MESARKDLERERTNLTARQQDFETKDRELAERQQAHAAAAQSLAEHTRAGEQVESRVQEDIRQLEPQRVELTREADALATRSQQLDACAAELDTARKAFAVAQSQLSQDQQEVARQRKGLLQRLGSAAPVQAPPQTGQTGPEVSGPSEASRSQGPKPAATQTSDQARKLRRDAKRRAIGV